MGNDGNIKTFLSTPSARRATNEDGQLVLKWYISIHALREEGDRHSPRIASPHSNFYPRPPRGGRRRYLFHAGGQASISIHALREEGDVKKGTITEDDYISIHALREEGDASLSAMI